MISDSCHDFAAGTISRSELAQNIQYYLQEPTYSQIYSDKTFREAVWVLHWLLLLPAISLPSAKFIAQLFAWYLDAPPAESGD